jgi:hypothetical protein
MKGGLNKLQRSVKALFDPGCFTHPITEIIKLRTSHFTATQNRNTLNARGMKQEDSLNSNTLENPTDGDGLADAAIALSNDSPFVGLNPFLVAFLNEDTDFNGVAHVDFGQFFLLILRFNRADNLLGVHRFPLKPQDLILRQS